MALLARARAVTLTNYPELARCLGVDPYELLARVGLPASALNDVENWLPGKKILDLLEETALCAGRDDLGILLGEFRSYASLGPVSLLLKHEATLGTVIDAMIEYRRLLNELLHLRLHVNGEDSLLSWSLIPGLRSSQGVNLLATIAYRVLVDGTMVNWLPECIHFRHSAPTNAAAFTRVFRCPVEFDSAVDGMSLCSKSLGLKNESADPELAAHARRLLNLMPGIRHDESALERATATIALLLDNGQADATNVARCLGITVRTLQRRLGDEGQTFSSLLNESRRDLALRYLGSSGQSITSVAQLTGYSTLSSFTRWFVSEFGMPPGEWRKAFQPAKGVEKRQSTMRRFSESVELAAD